MNRAVENDSVTDNAETAIMKMRNMDENMIVASTGKRIGCSLCYGLYVCVCVVCSLGSYSKINALTFRENTKRSLVIACTSIISIVNARIES